MEDEDFWEFKNEKEIKDMIEFLMRSTLNLENIKNEPILKNVPTELIEKYYYDIINWIFQIVKNKYLLDFKSFVFEVIKSNKPNSIEELTYLVNDYAYNMPITFQISTKEILDLWDMEYTEPNTNITKTFGEWVKIYNN